MGTLHTPHADRRQDHEAKTYCGSDTDQEARLGSDGKQHHRY
jgi:hypothetical protein